MSVYVQNVAPFSAYKPTHNQQFLWRSANAHRRVWNSSRWPVYVINSVDKSKLPCYILPPTRYHSFFRNLPPLFIQLTCWTNKLAIRSLASFPLTNHAQCFWHWLLNLAIAVCSTRKINWKYSGMAFCLSSARFQAGQENSRHSWNQPIQNLSQSRICKSRFPRLKDFTVFLP